LLGLGGCTTTNQSKQSESSHKKVVKVPKGFVAGPDHSISNTDSITNIYVITDKKTGVEYLYLNQFSDDDYDKMGNITPRLKANGKPYVNTKYKSVQK